MGHLSFRIKLLLALMTVVAGVTAVALWVTERQVAAAHGRLFREHVSAQLKYLPREQEARLGVAREQSRAFADLDAVRAAVEEHDGARLFRLARQQLEPMLDDAFADLAAQLEAERLHSQRLALKRRVAEQLAQLADTVDGKPRPQLERAPRRAPFLAQPNVRPPSYTSALADLDFSGLLSHARDDLSGRVGNQLRDIAERVENLPLAPPVAKAAVPAPQMARMAKRNGGPRRAPARKRSPLLADFMVFIGEQGEVLEVSRGFFQGLRARFRKQLETRISEIVELERQQVGYFALKIPHRTMLAEVVFTPVYGLDDGRKVGTFILGFPFADLAEQTIQKVGQMHNGIWLDGKVHSKTIPASALDPVAGWVRQQVDKASSTLDTSAKGVNDAEGQPLLVDVDNVPHRVFFAPLNAGSDMPVAYKIGLYSWAGNLQTQSELRDQILLTAGLLGLGTLAIGWVIALGMTKPIRRLYKATERLIRGDYEVRVPARSNDEIGKLSASFNKMAEGLSLKDRYRSALNKVADEEVADELMAGKAALGGKTRRMTVLFCDIRRYTEITAGMPPEEIVALLNEHMTALTRVVHEHGGVVDKFVGDMIMAVFGARKTDPEASARAVACGRHMIAERRVLNLLTGRDINIGVGIATGEMLAGFMGSEDRLNFTVIGQGANLASRLTAMAGPMELLVDEATAESAREGRDAEPLPPVEIKGFSELQAVYKLAVNDVKFEPEKSTADTALDSIRIEPATGSNPKRVLTRPDAS